MAPPRRTTPALVLLAAFSAFALSGCSSSEAGSSSPYARSGVLGALATGVTQGDNAAELKEALDSETTSEERQELREGLEREQSQGAGEQSGAPGEQPEAAGEQPPETVDEQPESASEQSEQSIGQEPQSTS
jgi:hypothetical protein